MHCAQRPRMDKMRSEQTGQIQLTKEKIGKCDKNYLWGMHLSASKAANESPKQSCTVQGDQDWTNQITTNRADLHVQEQK